jgi:hypothetical protein
MKLCSQLHARTTLPPGEQVLVLTAHGIRCSLSSSSLPEEKHIETLYVRSSNVSTWDGSSSSQASPSLYAQPLLNFSWCSSFLLCDMFSNLPVLILKTFFPYSPSMSIPSYNIFYLCNFQGVFIFQFSHSFISFSFFWLHLLISAACSLLMYLGSYPHVSFHTFTQTHIRHMVP